MRTVDATIEIKADGSIKLRLGAELEPGEHHGLLVLDEPQPARIGIPGVLSLPPLPLGFPDGMSFRREEIYSDDGR